MSILCSPAVGLESVFLVLWHSHGPTGLSSWEDRQSFLELGKSFPKGCSHFLKITGHKGVVSSWVTLKSSIEISLSRVQTRVNTLELSVI